ncbi:MAG TPA: sensor histidine kinase KdpD [Polyangiaceae bacterium]|nr:sensor histidine kinase KdpD [Polyangiaceae bacterium]
MTSRPDADELLRRVQAAERRVKRGRLTIFFGAAPGVGTTFAMLERAGFLRDVERLDVVVGIVETHGRFETTTLLAGFERLPLRQVTYQATTIEEFDLDGALARKPTLLLIDELAHTNAEGARHAKRWQDVEELLEANIDVYTTLNVQHVESLNDVIAQITGVVVRETVPDAVIDGAEEIKLVDLPPDALLERLREGKVYLPAQAERALENFFRKGNLIALRELTLRRTAEHVDADMQAWRREHAIENTWAASDRLLVCIGASPYSANLLRAGRRMASGLRARWFAVNVETPATLRFGPADRARISQNLRLAEQLGADTVTLTGRKPAEEILRFAREQNVTKIVVGKPRMVRLRDRLGNSFMDELILGSGDIDIYATVGQPEKVEPATNARPRPQRYGVGAYLAAVSAVTFATIAAYAAFGRHELADVVMLYLLAIVGVSMRFGFRASLLTGVLSVLAFDYFFVQPYLTFTVSDLRHVVTFAVMLLVGIVIAVLTQRVRDQAEVAQRSERRTAVLYAMSRELSRVEGPTAILDIAARHVEQVFESRVAILGGERNGKVRVDYATAGFIPPLDKEDGVARWVLGNRREAGSGTSTLAASSGFYLPLLAPGADATVMGVLALYPEEPQRFGDPEQQRLADAFATQIATSLERARLAEETERARREVEAEQLRSTLLSSVSHDLRTPLAVMKGAASTLVADDARLTPAVRRDLHTALLEETERLDRQVRNLLDMTRLESGAIRLKKEWYSLQEIVGATWSRMESRLSARPVTVSVDAELLVPVDNVLIEQVLVNLLENAAKYTPAGTAIDLAARRADGEIVVEVADRGRGIPVEERERIFEKFYRGPSKSTQGGVGLGLTICRAVVVAHGGRIWVENRDGGGASFKFALPLEGEPPPLARLPEITEPIGDGESDRRAAVGTSLP